LRYFYKCKENYTAHDICSMVHDGGFFGITNSPGALVFSGAARAERLNRVLNDSFKHYNRQGVDPTPGRTSSDYLPSLIMRDKRNEGFSKKELERGVSFSGRFKVAVGQYGNRNQRKILVLVEDAL
jgi:hypothetical protein